MLKALRDRELTGKRIPGGKRKALSYTCEKCDSYLNVYTNEITLKSNTDNKDHVFVKNFYCERCNNKMVKYTRYICVRQSLLADHQSICLC